MSVNLMYLPPAGAQSNTTVSGSDLAPVLSVASGPIWVLTGTSFEEYLDAGRITDSDFGKLESRQTFYRQRVGRYIVSRPITILTYWNVEGYTSVIDDFDSLYGYGESLQASIDDALIHLEQDRNFYGQIQDGTKAALELRSRLRSYLVPFFK